MCIEAARCHLIISANRLGEEQFWFDISCVGPLGARVDLTQASDVCGSLSMLPKNRGGVVDSDLKVLNSLYVGLVC